MGFHSAPTPHPWVSGSPVSQDGGSQQCLPAVLGQEAATGGSEEAGWRAGRSESEHEVNIVG